MPTKKEILEKLNKALYSVEEVKNMVNSVSNERLICPRVVVKGDVFTQMVGHKTRPCVVYKVRKGLAYAIPMTTTQDEMTVSPGKVGRFQPESITEQFFAKGVIVVKEHIVRTNFCFSYSPKKDIDEAIKRIKRLI